MNVADVSFLLQIVNNELIENLNSKFYTQVES